MKFNQIVAALPLAASLAAAAPFSKRADTDLSGKTLATWWGQDSTALSDVCSDDSFDIIMISFLRTLNPPTMNIGGHGNSATDAQKKKGWGGLVDGTIGGGSPSPAKSSSTPAKSSSSPAKSSVAPSTTVSLADPSRATLNIVEHHNAHAAHVSDKRGDTASVADQIKACQAKGKKVMISIGGGGVQGGPGAPGPIFKNSQDAKDAANQVWNLFLGGTEYKDVRPFGPDVVLDGMDNDNETQDGEFYTDFTSTLRGLMNGDKSKKYFISGTPMSWEYKHNDDTTAVPPATFKDMDFINIQFYNGNTNDAVMWSDDKDQFASFVQTWSDHVKKYNSNMKILMAATSSGDSGNTGYADAKTMEDKWNAVKGKNLGNIGGIALWDAATAIKNNNFQKGIKSFLK